MSNRYYICRRIGTGVTPTPYNSELRQYVQDTYGVQFKQQAISHTIPWVIMKYDLTQAQHDDVMLNVPQCYSFPQTALDNQLSTIDPTRRQAINAKLTEMGFNTSWVVPLTHTVRDVLQFLVHSIQLSEWADVQISNQNFDIQTKTVGDIPASRRTMVAIHLTNLGIDPSGIPTTTPLWQVIRMVQRQNDGVTPRYFGTKMRRWFYHDIEAD